MIAVHPSFPAHDYKGFVAELKKNPGKYSYSSSGTGGIGHLLDPRKGGRLPQPVIDLLFEIDYAEHRALAQKIPGFDLLNSIQQLVMVSMVFQPRMTQ